MTPARRALQQLQRELNGFRATTLDRLPAARLLGERPYVVQAGRACWCEWRLLANGHTDRFEFTAQGVVLLRAELAGLLGPDLRGRPVSDVSELSNVPPVAVETSTQADGALDTNNVVATDVNVTELVTWPQALRAAQAAGYTHFRMRLVNPGDGPMREQDGPFALIEDTLAAIAEDEDDFGARSDRIEFPFIHWVCIEGPLAGVVVATYEVIRIPSIWDRIRTPWLDGEPELGCGNASSSRMAAPHPTGEP